MHGGEQSRVVRGPGAAAACAGRSRRQAREGGAGRTGGWHGIGGGSGDVARRPGGRDRRRRGGAVGSLQSPVARADRSRGREGARHSAALPDRAGQRTVHRWQRRRGAGERRSSLPARREGHRRGGDHVRGSCVRVGSSRAAAGGRPLHRRGVDAASASKGCGHSRWFRVPAADQGRRHRGHHGPRCSRAQRSGGARGVQPHAIRGRPTVDHRRRRAGHLAGARRQA